MPDALALGGGPARPGTVLCTATYGFEPAHFDTEETWTYKAA